MVSLMYRDLLIDPASQQGPPDPEAVGHLRAWFGLDEGFLEQMAAVHFGVPALNTWTSDDLQFRITRFLSLYGLRTEIPGAPMPDGEGGDIRSTASMTYMVDGGHQAAEALFGLCPFAMLRDPQPTALRQSEIDMVCLDSDVA